MYKVSIDDGSFAHSAGDLARQGSQFRSWVPVNIVFHALSLVQKRMIMIRGCCISQPTPASTVSSSSCTSFEVRNASRRETLLPGGHELDQLCFLVGRRNSLESIGTSAALDIAQRNRCHRIICSVVTLAFAPPQTRTGRNSRDATDTPAKKLSEQHTTTSTPCSDTTLSTPSVAAQRSQCLSSSPASASGLDSLTRSIRPSWFGQ